MSIGIGANLSGSFGYAKDKIVGSIGNWILLIILSIIPIVDFIAVGTFLKVYRGEDPKVESAGKAFVDGLLALIIAFIYMLIPLIIFIIVCGTAIAGLATGSVAALAGAGVGGILCLILFILFGLIMTPAIVNFARKGFGAAFKFGEIFGMISKAGWLKYIGSIIVLGIIFGVIGWLIGLLGLIPVAGTAIMWIVLFILLPFFAVWSNKFWANLFE